MLDDQKERSEYIGRVWLPHIQTMYPDIRGPMYNYPQILDMMNLYVREGKETLMLNQRYIVHGRPPLFIKRLFVGKLQTNKIQNYK